MNRHTPNHLVALTPNGHQQAYNAGKVLREFLSQDRFDGANGSCQNQRSVLFYTSPYLRARQTCQGIIKGIQDLPGIEYAVNEEPRMREQDFGNFQSTIEEMEAIWAERAHYGHFFYRIPHGESAADVYDRIASFNESLYRQFQNDDFANVLVLVTHGIWARVFLMKWFRWSYEKFESLRNIPHCQFLIMKRDSKKYLLKTPLSTWDDLAEDDIENCTEIDKEIRDEIHFNSRYKLGNNLDDLDISSLIEAQKKAIRQSKQKDRAILQAFEKANSPTNPYLSVVKSLQFDNHSGLNSSESLARSPP